MSKKYLSWSITAVREDGKTENLTVDFGLDKSLCEAIERKLDELSEVYFDNSYEVLFLQGERAEQVTKGREDMYFDKGGI